MKGFLKPFFVGDIFKTVFDPDMDSIQDILGKYKVVDIFEICNMPVFQGSHERDMLVGFTAAVGQAAPHSYDITRGFFVQPVQEGCLPFDLFFDILEIDGVPVVDVDGFDLVAF